MKMDKTEIVRQRLLHLLDQCLDDAKILAIKHGINTDENRAQLAIALFQKRSPSEGELGDGTEP